MVISLHFQMFAIPCIMFHPSAILLLMSGVLSHHYGQFWIQGKRKLELIKFLCFPLFFILDTFDQIFQVLFTFWVVSSAYRRLLMFLPPIFTPIDDVYRLHCLMIDSAYKLNRAGDKMHSCRTLFVILNQSVLPNADTSTQYIILVYQLKS